MATRPAAVTSQVNVAARRRPRSRRSSTRAASSSRRPIASARASVSPGGDRERGVADHLGQRPGGRGHHRRPGGHRLEGRQAEALVDRRVGVDRGAAEQGRPLAFVDPPEPADAVAVRAGRDGVGEGIGAPAVGARDHESEIGTGGGDAVEGVAPAWGGPCGARRCRRRARSGRSRRARGRRRRRRRVRRPAAVACRRGPPRRRSASTPNSSAISAATNAEPVWTVAPRRRARRMSPG